MKRIRAAGCEIPNMQCRECGARYEANSVTQVFCTGICRTRYDHRRIDRGKVLYDIFMELRYNRGGAVGLWSIMCRLAEQWRNEDKRIRSELKSWNDPRKHIEKQPHLMGKRGRI